MDTTMLLSCAGELSALIVSGGLLFAASVAAKQSRKREREEDEEAETSDAKKEEELSDGEEDSISVEWKQLKKLLKTKMQIELVHKPPQDGDEKYARLNFSSKLSAKHSANDESRLIKALSDAGIKVLGSEDFGVLCVSKSDLGFMSSEEVLRRLGSALSAYDAATAAAAASATSSAVENEADASNNGESNDADEEESVVSSSGRRRRVTLSKVASAVKAPASAAKRRKTTSTD